MGLLEAVSWAGNAFLAFPYQGTSRPIELLEIASSLNLYSQHLWMSRPE
jgi:hypothetical protein